MPIIDISRELTTATPYAGDPAPRMHALATHEQDGYQLQAVVMSLHAATHVDAPLHFLKGGSDVAALPLDAFFGPCTVLTVPSGPLDAAFFLRGFLPELYGELRAKYDAELNRSVLILQDDVPYS